MRVPVGILLGAILWNAVVAGQESRVSFLCGVLDRAHDRERKVKLPYKSDFSIQTPVWGRRQTIAFQYHFSGFTFGFRGEELVAYRVVVKGGILKNRNEGIIDITYSP